MLYFVGVFYVLEWLVYVDRYWKTTCLDRMFLTTQIKTTLQDTTAIVVCNKWYEFDFPHRQLFKIPFYRSLTLPGICILCLIDLTTLRAHPRVFRGFVQLHTLDMVHPWTLRTIAPDHYPVPVAFPAVTVHSVYHLRWLKHTVATCRTYPSYIWGIIAEIHLNW